MKTGQEVITKNNGFSVLTMGSTLMKWERKLHLWEAFTILGLAYMWMEYLLR